MLQKFKKAIPVIAMVLLFSSTIVYAYDLEKYMSPGEVAYTALRKKSTENNYAKVVSIVSPNSSSIRYVVLNSEGYPKSEQKTANEVSTIYLSYDGYNVQKGDYVKLKAQNNAADNSGRFVTLQMDWTP